jgi:hypothetical protein
MRLNDLRVNPVNRLVRSGRQFAQLGTLLQHGRGPVYRPLSGGYTILERVERTKTAEIF